MNRPIYENNQSRADEERIAGIVAERWKCNVHRMPRLYELDYLAERDGKTTCFIEIKCRKKIKFGIYEDFTISLAKAMIALAFADNTGLPVFFVVEFSGGIYWTQLVRHLTVRLGGRTDRNDPNDVEPMACIPWQSFKAIPS